MKAWWQLVPDICCTALSVIAASPQMVAYTLRFEGNDSLSGGRTEIVFSVVTRFEGGRTREAHIFESAAEASDYFAKQT